jgi:hypothetical protein
MSVVLSRCMRQTIAIPRWNTGHLWLLRLGLYKLSRVKEQSDDWVWIIDHTIQIGVEKCLVILGIRLGHLKDTQMNLKHEDMEPIEIMPVKKSNGEIIFKQLEKAAKKTGAPRQIVSDGGRDLKRGIEMFCEQHEQTSHVYDIKHKTAIVLKHEFEHDETWNEFIRLACQTRKKVLQTPLAYLAPLNPRAKARYMNMEMLVAWGERISLLLKNPSLMNQETDTDKLMERFGWLRAFDAAIQEWSEILGVMKTTEGFVREHGLYHGSSLELEKRLKRSDNERTKKIRSHMIEFVDHESSKAHPEERLLGSSEVIESVFGKFKRMEQNQSTSGLTRLVLAIGAMVSQTTENVVQKALETVPTKRVLAWCKKMLGQSVQSKRNKFMNSRMRAEQKWGHLGMAA